MSMINLEAAKEKLDTLGTIMFAPGETFLTDEEFNTLEALAESLPLEHVEVGDADEPNFLDVARFLTDVEKIELVNRPTSDKAIEILGKPELMEKYCFLLGVDKVFLRRMQYNILHENSFVGLHLDTDSNPDYLVAIVIQFGREFEGGDYIVYGGDMPPRVFHPERYSITVSRCNFSHEVTKLTRGKRKSLVYFLSQYGAENRRIRS